jgi:HK97 gp10 family phage protein
MARKHKGRLAVRIRFDGLKEIAGDLEKVGLTLRSPEVTAEIQRGADIMAARAKARAPQDIGNLRAGIYTVSALRDGFRPLTRRGKRINSGLRYPARPGQVLLVSSVFYSRFVEQGRSKKSKRGYMRRRPYFKSAVNESRQIAQSFMLARIRKLIESKLGSRR